MFSLIFGAMLHAHIRPLIVKILLKIKGISFVCNNHIYLSGFDEIFRLYFTYRPFQLLFSFIVAIVEIVLYGEAYALY